MEKQNARVVEEKGVRKEVSIHLADLHLENVRILEKETLGVKQNRI
jgi:predicted nucleic acid-binding protein